MAREKPEVKFARLMEHELVCVAGGRVAAGIDEAGRGPLAGPVVAACVIMEQDRAPLGVDDSKKLSEARREALYPRIMDAALYVGVGMVSPGHIDVINILNATRRAMEQAASGCPADCFFVDAVSGLRLPGELHSIVRGDQICYCIAAASIIAKVTRDRYMRVLDEMYPEYGFARHKGYGTRRHYEALRAHGPCPEHRRSFLSRVL